MDLDDIGNHDEQLVTLQVYVPDLFIQKNFLVQKEELIWDIKQEIIASLPKEIKESFNYGIFCPPLNGKAGKFLDEHRPISDYPFYGSIGYAELRYKQRIYKMMNVEEKQIKQLHTRSNLKRMLDYVSSGQVEKIIKMCSRGLDPNFHCLETGETPLTLTTTLKQPAKIIMALINGGALLDFRTKDGLTALHKAVERNNLEALKTSLDLGASPNYKESKGLTPLYYTLLHASDHQLTEVLLHERAFIGTCDPQGWQEVHQACKHGLVQHLEHLLFYGANMNARNASGNTPLHVCAANDQEACARVLLFRGADKGALNYANQNPYQVAIIAGNLKLGELIHNHSANDVVPFREMPRYNPRRRASIAPVSMLCRTHSDPRLDLSINVKPPSPCPSNCSLPPFSSVSCMSDASTGSSSTYTQPSGEDSEDTASESIITEKSIVSDSSGVCTSNSATSYDSGPEHRSISDAFSGNIYMCVKDYTPSHPGHLQLSKGNIIEALNKVEDGFLFGKANCKSGVFPVTCVEQIDENFFQVSKPYSFMSKNDSQEMVFLKDGTSSRKWKVLGEPRTVILHKGKKGFGFVLRGAKASSPLIEQENIEFWPSQYLEDVGKGGVADLAGLKKGDYLLEINGEDVSQASHEHVVSIIQQSGNLVAMTVVTLENPLENVPSLHRQWATLPHRFNTKKVPVPPKRDPKTTLSVGRVKARSLVAGLAEIETLDAALFNSERYSSKSNSFENIPKNATTKLKDPQMAKTASIKARPSSQRICAVELEEFFQRQLCDKLRSNTVTSKSSPLRPPKVYDSVAAMKRSKALRSKLTEVVNRIHKKFYSTPDLKDSIANSLQSQQVMNKKSFSQEDVNVSENCQHSLAWISNVSDNYDYDLYHYNNDAWKSTEDVYDNALFPVAECSNIYAQTLPIPKKVRASCPPPTHPPPPPPIGQVVKVDVSKALGEYANANMMNESKSSHIMSSFRPGDSAKLYASPEIVMSIGYRSDALKASKDSLRLRRTAGEGSPRSHSLPPKITSSKSERGSTASSDAENSGDSGGMYSTFKKINKQRDSLSTDSGHISDRGTLRSLKNKTKFNIQHFDSSPQHYPKVLTPSHEPFIPEPDYESSEDDYLPTSVDQCANLVTFGKGSPLENEAARSGNEDVEPLPSLCPHEEAKRAIQEARERLRFPQKPLDKNATVVFISGKITERKVEKSEIQLHRTEEGRLTGTVVISTTNEPYLSSSVIKCYGNEKDISRYPSRDAPASEYAKYRQQILSGMMGSSQLASLTLDDSTGDVPKNNKADEDVAAKSGNELKIILTGAQKGSSSSGENVMSRDTRVNSSGCTSNSGTPKANVIHSTSLEDIASESVLQLVKKDEQLIVEVSNQPQNIIPVPKKGLEERETLSVDMESISNYHNNRVTCNDGSVNINELSLGRENVQMTNLNTFEDLNHVDKPKVEETDDEMMSSFVGEQFSTIEPDLRKDLDVMRVQNSLGLTVVSEVNALSELVPPPPEFAASTDNVLMKKTPFGTPEVAIAPPPEFSDVSIRSQNKTSSLVFSSSLQKQNDSAQKSRNLELFSDTASVMSDAKRKTIGASYNNEIHLSRRSNPKTFHENSSRHLTFTSDVSQVQFMHKEFRFKTLQEWTINDTADWLDSLFLPEYKHRFLEAGITGAKLANMDSNDLMGLGVKPMGHRLNMERSLKRYMK